MTWPKVKISEVSDQAADPSVHAAEFPNDVNAAEFTNGLYQFDPVSAEWTNLSLGNSAGSPPSSRMNVPAVGAGGRLYLFGGYLESGTLQQQPRQIALPRHGVDWNLLLLALIGACSFWPVRATSTS